MVGKLNTLVRLIIKAILVCYLRSRIYKTQTRLVGSEYGNWYLPLKVNEMSSGVCLVGGVGEDISFELELLMQSDLAFQLYDFTPRAALFFKKNIDAIINGELLPDHEGYHINGKLESVDVSRLEFYMTGIGTQSGSIAFKKPSNPKHVSFSLGSVGSTSEKEIFDVVDFSAIVAKIEPKSRHIVKLDIEGSELALICSENHRNALFSFEIVLIEFDFLKFASFKEIRLGIKNLLKCRDTHNVYYADDYNVGFLRK